jgi:hypothetical protein
MPEPTLKETVAQMTSDPAEQAFLEASLSSDPEYMKSRTSPEPTPSPAPVKEPTPSDGAPSDGTPSDGAPSPEPIVEEPVDFVDDVLPGLKGEQLAKLPEELQVIIAKTRKDLDDLKAEKAAAEADPVTAERLKRIKEGKTDNLYDLQGLSVTDATRLQGLLTSGRVDDFNKEIKKLSIKLAEEHIGNTDIEKSITDKQKKTLSDAGKVLLEVSKLNKSFALDISDPADIIGIKPDHKSFENYKKGVGTILSGIAEMKNAGVITDVAAFIAQTDPKALYAMFAAKNNWPVVMNADAVINKQVLDRGKELLKQFQKGGIDHGAPVVADGLSVNQEKARQSSVESGIDLKKLASDPIYHQKVLEMKPYDSAWIDQVAEMRIRGQK